VKPGDLFRRNRYQTTGVSIFRENSTLDFDWIALVLKITPPSPNTSHYTTIEALVTPDNLVMKALILEDEIEEILEVLK
jgi:hypothetical protein